MAVAYVYLHLVLSVRFRFVSFRLRGPYRCVCRSVGRVFRGDRASDKLPWGVVVVRCVLSVSVSVGSQPSASDFL